MAFSDIRSFVELYLMEEKVLEAKKGALRKKWEHIPVQIGRLNSSMERIEYKFLYYQGIGNLHFMEWGGNYATERGTKNSNRAPHGSDDGTCRPGFRKDDSYHEPGEGAG